MIKTVFSILSILLIASTSHAAEETLDLENEKAPPPKAEALNISKFQLMGRVDLTSEISPYKPETGEKENTLKNNHFLIFLKVKASPKTSFMGEFVRQSFYYVDYAPSSLATVQFGKILVPFGDTRHFHHMYGGIQGYGANGVMFPNIWAEPGINVNWHLSSVELDTYCVNSISADTGLVDPSLQTSTPQRQAGGTRLTLPIVRKLTGILSGYFGEFWPGRPLIMGGADTYSDYGLIDYGFFRNIRMAAGIADASMKKAPISGDFEKRGDYLELGTNALGFAELRARYGTYIDNSRFQTKNDVHNLDAGLMFNVDVIRVLAEYQWNFEAVDEFDNDVARIMASLDF
jgi:hypothetical protein